jgi:hypothetical protein
MLRRFMGRSGLGGQRVSLEAGKSLGLVGVRVG